MKLLNENVIHSKLSLNLAVHIDGIGNFKAPTITDVNMYNEYYNKCLSIILFDKNKLDVNLDEYSNFEVLLSVINYNDKFRELFFNALNIHLDECPKIHSNGQLYFRNYSTDSVLTEEKFEYIKKLIRIANQITENNLLKNN